MHYIILDLEWSRSFSKSKKTAIDEIIEFGAVKVDESLVTVDVFGMLVKPVVGKKIDRFVAGLTKITDETVGEAFQFPYVYSKFRNWIGSDPCVVVSWGTSDIVVLLENIEYFLHERFIPFMKYYSDLQFCVRKKYAPHESNQMALTEAAQLLHIEHRHLNQHRAPDDALLTAECFKAVYDGAYWDKFVRTVNPNEQKKLFSGQSYIKSLNSPHVNRKKLRSNCKTCGRFLKRTTEWRLNSNHFTANFHCGHCSQDFRCTVQFRRNCHDVRVKRKISLMKTRGS